MKVPQSFFMHTDVVWLARQMLGMQLHSLIDGVHTAGRIVETEAYQAFTDKACHAFGGKRTPRNEMMYAPGGTAYVYICYGMHHLFNVVTNQKDVPDAVLVRALEPIKGLPHMLQRRGMASYGHHITKGPGALSAAMGFISAQHNGTKLGNKRIWLEYGSLQPHEELACSARIGVESAGTDALRPWRFFIQGHKNVSAYKKGTVLKD